MWRVIRWLRAAPLWATPWLALLAVMTRCGDAAAPTASGTPADAQADHGQTDGPARGLDGAPSLQPDGDATAPSCPGGPGCTCKENQDCNAGVCLDTPEARLCAAPCSENCPDPYRCAAVLVGSDAAFFCVHRYLHLCDPCRTNKDCATLGQKVSLCVNHGGEGAFCATECGTDSDCPSGYQCAAATSIEGGAATLQCVRKPDAGACPCSPLARQLSLSTDCAVATAAGTCSGVRSCGQAGLGPCGAPAAVSETCNGADDDCNGKIDEATCDDGNPCTQDACGGAAGCSHQTSTAGCNADDSVCTENDVCKSGTCVAGPAKGCDDGNPCTVDGCAPATGCSHGADDGKPCNDGNACTVGDVCKAGACAVGAPLPCTSTGSCTTAACDAASGTCKSSAAADGQPCSDGSLCTAQDACAGGVCAATPIACNDGNPCTVDSCTPATGCSYAIASAPCSDGNACTVGDLCGNGSCVAGKPKVCDDGDACSVDSCDTQAGTCKQTPIVGCGGKCADATTCADANPCTDDQCLAGLCANGFNAAACNDGNPCTAGDQCLQGSCAGKPAVCDDANPCTVDDCDAKLGCTFVPKGNVACSDGNACTVGDACASGLCKPGVATVCADLNGCTADQCNPATGGCVFAPQAATCSDDNACTVGDSCKDGTCAAGLPKDCSDGNACTTDTCATKTGACAVVPSVGGCEDGNLCTGPDVCSASACKSGPAVCDDANPCTQDSCAASSGKCSHVQLLGPCEDGDKCTVGDKCSLGKCLGGGPADCNDSNLCTQDACGAAAGCTHTAVPDETLCAAGVCAAGVCKVQPTLLAVGDHVCAQIQGIAGTACWGRNNLGQLGDGTKLNSTVPLVQKTLPPAVSLAVGAGHTCAALTDGTVRCWGDNNHGQLGNGTSVDSLTPVTVTSVGAVVQVAAAGNTSYALTADGVAWAWGDGAFGQLGHGLAVASQAKPVKVALQSPTVRLVAVGTHACALATNGGMFCWGSGVSAALGDGNVANKNSPVQALVSGKVVALGIGATFGAAITADGALWTWGGNTLGQLGTGLTTALVKPAILAGAEKFVAVACGTSHLCAVKNDGQVWCWGANSLGQLGLGSTAVSVPKPTAPVVDGTAAGPLGKVVQLATGTNTTCARVGGLAPKAVDLRCWGSGTYGTLGVGSKQDSAQALAVTP